MQRKNYTKKYNLDEFLSTRIGSTLYMFFFTVWQCSVYLIGLMLFWFLIGKLFGAKIDLDFINACKGIIIVSILPGIGFSFAVWRKGGL